MLVMEKSRTFEKSFKLYVFLGFEGFYKVFLGFSVQRRQDTNFKTQEEHAILTFFMSSCFIECMTNSQN